MMVSPALAAGLPQTPSPRWYVVDHKKVLPQAGRRSLAAGCPPPLPPPRPSEVRSPQRRMWTRSAYPGSMAPGEGAAPPSALCGQPQTLASQRLQDAVLYAEWSREGRRQRTRVRP